MFDASSLHTEKHINWFDWICSAFYSVVHIRRSSHAEKEACVKWFTKHKTFLYGFVHPKFPLLVSLLFIFPYEELCKKWTSFPAIFAFFCVNMSDPKKYFSPNGKRIASRRNVFMKPIGHVIDGHLARIHKNHTAMHKLLLCWRLSEWFSL